MFVRCRLGGETSVARFNARHWPHSPTPRRTHQSWK